MRIINVINIQLRNTDNICTDLNMLLKPQQNCMLLSYVFSICVSFFNEYRSLFADILWFKFCTSVQICIYLPTFVLIYTLCNRCSPTERYIRTVRIPGDLWNGHTVHSLYCGRSLCTFEFGVVLRHSNYSNRIIILYYSVTLFFGKPVVWIIHKATGVNMWT